MKEETCRQREAKTGKHRDGTNRIFLSRGRKGQWYGLKLLFRFSSPGAVQHAWVCRQPKPILLIGLNSAIPLKSILGECVCIYIHIHAYAWVYACICMHFFILYICMHTCICKLGVCKSIFTVGTFASSTPSKPFPLHAFALVGGDKNPPQESPQLSWRRASPTSSGTDPNSPEGTAAWCTINLLLCGWSLPFIEVSLGGGTLGPT